jgi:hypothetical protein
MKAFSALCTISFLLAGSCTQPSTAPYSDAQKSCLDFVQAFYDWYVPKTQERHPVATWELAMNDKGSAFSTELLTALREDAEARAKAPQGELVGLDADPLLASQDPYPRYELDDVMIERDRCLVGVYGVQSGDRRPKPDVVAELATKDGRWHFINFHYEGNVGDSNLLNTLKAHKDENPQSER